MHLRKIIQDYFTFSRKERNGIIVLLVIIILLAIANRLIFLFEKPGNIDIKNFQAEVNEFRSQLNRKKTVSLFKFDPNEIDSLSLNRLDIPPRIRQNILKYRAKGGHFFKPEDFRKLYGMNDSVFLALKDYVTIERHENRPEERKFKIAKVNFFPFDPDTMKENDWRCLGLTDIQVRRINRYKQSIGGHFETKGQFSEIYGIGSQSMDSLLKYIQIKNRPATDKGWHHQSGSIDLNSADTVLLKSLPGIGSVLSRRIIKYRDLLGGFYSITQLKEVYGLKPEVFQKIEQQVRIDTLVIKKINLNFISFEELSEHPYIGKNQARKIIKFRSENGEIKRSSVLVEKGIITSIQMKKIAPYLELKAE